MMKHIVAKRALSCWAALWCCACEMGSSCGSALLFWDMKSSLLFYRAKLERQTRDEDSKAKMLTLDDVQQVLSYHISLSSLTTWQTCQQQASEESHATRDAAVYLIRHSFREAAMQPFKLWLSIYTIYKLSKFNSAQQFHLIFVSTHIKQMPWGAFATLEISKKTRSRLFTHGICSHMKCLMVYLGGGCNPYLSIFSKWTHCFWSHAFWKCLHS